MRKRLIEEGRREHEDERWLDLEDVADVEISSEHPDHPIEGALLPSSVRGWRAASSGTQTIRLLFTQPQRLVRVCLRFTESDVQRTQEYALRWSSDRGKTFYEIVRQQWTFSPSGATEELEDYRVNLTNVSVIELSIKPDIGGGAAVASLDKLQLA